MAYQMSVYSISVEFQEKQYMVEEKLCSFVNPHTRQSRAEEKDRLCENKCLYKWFLQKWSGTI
jgi:hypothetical protein